ncbi:MAG: hypothetical protein ABGF52_05765, partial [Candidatus Asgardarchaeum sp.]
RIGCGVAALLAEWNAHPRANPIKYATMVVYSISIIFFTDKKECGGKIIFSQPIRIFHLISAEVLNI